MKAIKFRTDSSIPAEEQTVMVFDALSVIISADILSPTRKSAAALLLSYFIPDWREMVEKDAVVVDRNDPLVYKWRKKVLERDNYTCVKCGNKGTQAHHKIYWSHSPVHRIDVKNGITLCDDCHAKEHKGEKAERLILSRKR